MGASAFLFVAHTAAAAEKLRSKSRLWYNTLRGKVCPSMADSSQRLVVDIGLRHVNWITSEALVRGLVSLLSKILSNTHPVVANLFSLMFHNVRERQAKVEWAA